MQCTARVRQTSDHLSRGRVDDRLALAIGAVAPFTVDVELDVGVHVDSFGWIGQTVRLWPAGPMSAGAEATDELDPILFGA